jgi:hypothetical protein
MTAADLPDLVSRGAAHDDRRSVAARRLILNRA